MDLDGQDNQQLHDIPECDMKIMSHKTTKFCATQTSPSVPAFDFDACLSSSTDASFELTMHLDNIENMSLASDRYLEECLADKYNKNEGFKDRSLQQGINMPAKEENELEAILVHNQLFDQDMTKELLAIIEKEDGMIAFLREVPKKFGLTAGKEIVYVIYQILKCKYHDYNELIVMKDPIIPKMPCFHDYDGEQLSQLATSCPVYEDISVEEVVAFAEKGIDKCAHSIYFGDLRILNLKQTPCEWKKSVNIIDKFTKLVSQISKSVFLTLVGATEPPQGSYGLEISRQFSLAEFSDYNLSVQHSVSRPLVVYDDEESYDFVSKKIKFQ